jgi:uncharacterized protein
MLQVDLGQLDKRRRIRIDAQVPADDPMWESADFSLDAPLQVHLEAQRAGPDVVVRGRLDGSAAMHCRRCLTRVPVRFGEEVTFLFRAGLTAQEAEQEEAFVLPERGTELDLWPAVLEQVLLAVPHFVLCREDCQGFCPQCGKNLNQGKCNCTRPVGDERWAALRRLAKE